MADIRSPPHARPVPDMLINVAQPSLGPEEAEAVAGVIARGWITEGPACEEFSARLNELIGVPHGVFAPNGTLALVLGLMALGVGPGDEVLVPDTTFIGSANAVLMVGATPVFVDVDPNAFQIDLAHAHRLVTPRTRAIMPVHLYGSACDMGAVASFAARYRLLVIEDAAQAIGVTQGGRHVGGLGDVGCFSFFGDKNITTGEGGYVVCRDPAVFERLRYARNQGRLERGGYVHQSLGGNFRITDLQAAIGLAQLAKLPGVLARKRAIHADYCRLLGDLREVRILGGNRPDTYVPFRCVLITRRAHDLMAALADDGVQTRGFFYPLHKQPCFANLRNAAPWEDGDFPNAMSGYANGLCLPLHPALTQDEVAFVAGRVRRFYR